MQSFIRALRLKTVRHYPTIISHVTALFLVRLYSVRSRVRLYFTDYFPTRWALGNQIGSGSAKSLAFYTAHAAKTCLVLSTTWHFQLLLLGKYWLGFELKKINIKIKLIE